MRLGQSERDREREAPVTSATLASLAAAAAAVTGINGSMGMGADSTEEDFTDGGGHLEAGGSTDVQDTSIASATMDRPLITGLEAIELQDHDRSMVDLFTAPRDVDRPVAPAAPVGQDPHVVSRQVSAATFQSGTCATPTHSPPMPVRNVSGRMIPVHTLTQSGGLLPAAPAVLTMPASVSSSSLPHGLPLGPGSLALAGRLKGSSLELPAQATAGLAQWSPRMSAPLLPGLPPPMPVAGASGQHMVLSGWPVGANQASHGQLPRTGAPNTASMPLLHGSKASTEWLQAPQLVPNQQGPMVVIGRQQGGSPPLSGASSPRFHAPYHQQVMPGMLMPRPVQGHAITMQTMSPRH